MAVGGAGGGRPSQSHLLQYADEQFVDAVVQYRRHVDVLARVGVRQRSALCRINTQLTI